MRRALTAILVAAVIAVIIGGVAMHRMVRDFAAEPHSDGSTPLIATRQLSDINL